MYYQQPPPPGSPANAPSAPPADDTNVYAPPPPAPVPANGSFMYTAAGPTGGGAVGPRVSVPVYPTIPPAPMPMQQQQPIGYQQPTTTHRSSFTMARPSPQMTTMGPTNQQSSFYNAAQQQQQLPQAAPMSAPSTPTGQRQQSNSAMLVGGYGPVTPSMQPPSPLMHMPQLNAHGRPASSPSSVVELRLKCRGLKKSDLLSESDPFVVVYLEETTSRTWCEVGRTETVTNTSNPTFTKAFVVDFFFEEVQRLRFEVFDRDSTSEKLSAHDFLGCVELTMGQLMAAKGQSMVLALLQKETAHVHGLKGHVVIAAEEVSTCAEMLNVTFAASKVDNKDGWFGKSDPFLNIYRLIDDSSADPASPNAWIHVWKSETVMDNLNPRWRPTTLSVQTLCNGNLDRKLKFECMDWEASGRHQFIGAAICTTRELLAGERTQFELINRARQLKKGKRYRNSGVLQLLHLETFKQHTFAEFLRGGCEISLIVGIDYTASNGAPSDPSSLHYTGSSYMGQLNDYQAAIQATGSILEPYDADHKFPLYGFGGMVNGAVSHCFPLTFDPSQPEVDGVYGILQAYANSFQFVQLHGPTYFAPLVQQAAAIATHFSTPTVDSTSLAGLKYFVLMIITDGAIMDMQATIDAIVNASFLPLSIVIVGVGNADFSAMDTLDGDGKLLVDSRRRTAARDIVQFVPFNQFRSNPARLAKETLAEIPMQLTQYFKTRGIKPNAPLERMGTSQLIGMQQQRPSPTAGNGGGNGGMHQRQSLTGVGV